MVDPAMPDMDPTHLLTLYYAKERKMGWHRDEGSNDGKSEQPVVSLSVGNTCEFHVKHDEEEG
jgi:alkylated DNA repair dioxygenase AlkB